MATPSRPVSDIRAQAAPIEANHHAMLLLGVLTAAVALLLLLPGAAK